MDETKAAPQTVDEYISRQSADVQEILNKLRSVIKEAAPGAEEKISYQMPAYFLRGPLVYFSTFRHHIGFFPTADGKEAFLQELSQYKGGKGTVQFPLDKPIPYELVAKIVRYRVLQNTGKK